MKKQSFNFTSPSVLFIERDYTNSYRKTPDSVKRNGIPYTPPTPPTPTNVQWPDGHMYNTYLLYNSKIW